MQGTHLSRRQSVRLFVITIASSCTYIYPSAASHAGHSSAAAGNPIHAYSSAVFVITIPFLAHTYIHLPPVTQGIHLQQLTILTTHIHLPPAMQDIHGNSFRIFVITIPSFIHMHIFICRQSRRAIICSSRQSFPSIFITYNILTMFPTYSRCFFLAINIELCAPRLRRLRTL